MLLLQDYLNNPCGTSSIPYWKCKGLVMPKNMKIVHEQDYSIEAFTEYNDEPYFRLYHFLKSVGQISIPSVETVFDATDINGFVQLINSSYTDISVTTEQIESYQRTPVFCPELWLLLKEKDTGIIVGGGIADFDNEIGKVILEWIQVFPPHRGHSLGQLIVNALLTKMQRVAKFATVSGKVNNVTKPEMLYRKCGFTGNDVWYVLTKK